MATISTNDIIVNYKLGDVSALTQLQSKFSQVSKEEQDVLDKAKTLSSQFQKTGNDGKQAGDKIASGIKGANNEGANLS